MHEIDIRKSLLISLAVHAGLFLIFSLIIIKNPFRTSFEQITVNIQTESESLTSGIAESIRKPVSRERPRMTERVTKPLEKKAVPEKTSPSAAVLKNFSRKKDFAKNTPSAVVKKELKSEPVKKEITRDESTDRKVENKQAEMLEKQKVNRELNAIAGDIDKALDESIREPPAGSPDTAVGSGKDPLGDAQWSLKPRKTVFFPNIQSKIPAKYKKKGMSYSITTRISFDKNGLAQKVDIITSSGDPVMDGIFYTELKKIRVEPIDANRIDIITKKFTVSLK